MVKVETLEIITANINLIKQFLLNAGSSLQTFRYFEKRNLEIIHKHLLTNVLLKEKKVIGYGHLEMEKDKVWLGIAIVESQLGMGFGLYLMNSLIDSAKKLQIKLLYLSVDKVNIGAIKLYEKVGFFKVDELNNNSFLMKKEL
jgi:RimJ/RimL family protein N-acetyltransferase